MGWLGSGFIGLGMLALGNKVRVGWLCMVCGEFCWGTKGYLTSQWDLVTLSTAFVILYCFNFRKWAA